MRENIRILFAGGGTGGHVFPAIYMADYFKTQWGANCLFIGTKKGIENVKVAQAGFPVKHIWISGLRRGFYLSNILFPFRLLISLIQARRELRLFQPDVVIGTGGYVAGPVLYQAAKLKIPTAIQEQNSYPGITTRLLAKKVDMIFIAYEEAQKYLNTDKPCMVVGNPVKMSITRADKNEARSFFGLKPGRKTVLIIGGSQGSLNINNAIDKLLQSGTMNNLQIIWQTGEHHFDLFATKYKNFKNNGLRIMPFIDRMDFAYSTSDFAICRAGAMTLTELSVAGLPAILVPYPHAAAQHQLKNAQMIAQLGGALIVEDKPGMENMLARAIHTLCDEPERLEKMSEKIRAFNQTDTLSRIASELQKLLSGAHD
jgi:UDP-N-acetylglucosamine--N-acetylmuramyl-(pentapeptide) pyrophosphoryl-undecaprenol N-acetylglucosamine transferase